MLALALTDHDITQSLETAQLFVRERQQFLIGRLTQVFAERELAAWGEAFEHEVLAPYLGRFDDDEVEEALLAYIRLAWERDDRFLQQQYEQMGPRQLAAAWALYPQVSHLFAHLAQATASQGADAPLHLPLPDLPR